MDYPLNDILQNAEDHGYSKDFINDIELYAKRLMDKNLPVIYSLPHLAMYLNFEVGDVNNMTSSHRRKYYKRFKLQKRSGGLRTIQSPDSPLKYIQRWILKHILNQIPSHEACMGFDPETSILKNATVHINQEAVMKIDLLRFFDSVNERRVFGIFKGIGYHPNLAVTMAKLCTIEPGKSFFSAFRSYELFLKEKIQNEATGILPQGGACSPKLGNLIARSLDKRIFGLCQKNGLVYSRYADDLTISGKLETLVSIKKVIYHIVQEEGFFVNLGKTRLLVRGQKFMVTGLNIHNDRPKVPRARKKDIEHHLFHCKHGVQRHLIKAKIKNRNFKDWLLGSICFVYGIEPEVGKKYFTEFAEIDWPV